MRALLLALLLPVGLIFALPATADCVCKGCGCKGGPGWRGPDGQCVYWERLQDVCGNPPGRPCKYEGAPQVCSKNEPVAARPNIEIESDDVGGDFPAGGKPLGDVLTVPEDPTAERSVSYVAIVEPALDGRPARLSFPDFQGCRIETEGLDEAHRQAPATAIACAQSLRRRGLPLPAPRTLDEIYGSSEWVELLRGSVAFPVKLPVAMLED